MAEQADPAVRWWRPGHRYQVWYDRTVFHFLTTSRARQQYLRTLDRATGDRR